MENSSQLLSRITITPGVMVGKPVVRGMRITVEQILKALASGQTIKDLVEEFPVLEEADIYACLLYASQLVEQERVYPLSA